MNKKVIIGLFIALAICTVVLFYTKAKAKKVLMQSASDAGGKVGEGAAGTQKPNILSQAHFPLHMGSKGDAVKFIQHFVGVTADGVWGPKTDLAVRQKLGTAIIDEQQYKNIASGSAMANV